MTDLTIVMTIGQIVDLPSVLGVAAHRLAGERIKGRFLPVVKKGDQFGMFRAGRVKECERRSLWPWGTVMNVLEQCGARLQLVSLDRWRRE